MSKHTYTPMLKTRERADGKYHVGFTGTVEGMSVEQIREVKRLLSDLQPTHVHHGDCVGADSQFHDLAEGTTVHIHPPGNPKKRAFRRGNWQAPPRPYLQRNQDIVNSSHALIACPKEYVGVLRSGTWATVRRAMKKGIPVYLVIPSGEVEILFNPEGEST